MNLSEFFIKRPVATTLLLLGILVMGGMAYQLLPISDLPNIDFPTIQVSAGLPGASPDTMASAVALPLEKQLSTIAGLTSISSNSSLGNANITLQFDLSRNIDSAGQDVQAIIAKTTRALPPGMPAPPSLQKSNPADQPVMFLTMQSETLPMSLVDQYAQTIAQRLSQVNGVAQVNVNGSRKYAVRVDVDPRELGAYGIGIDEIASAIGSANVNVPTGTLYGKTQNMVVQVNGQLLKAASYGQIIIAYRNGNPVHLDDVAHVFDGVENDNVGDWFMGKPSVDLGVTRQPGTNVVQVVDDVKALVPELDAQLPAALKLTVRSDRALAIRNSVHDVKLTLLFTVFLVILVIYLFLRNVSATLIPSLALPSSIVGTFAVMYELGYTLDNLSLMALTLSVGFVVDDAIVMLENIVRHMEMGKTPMRAAYDGSAEIAFTIISMTMSLAVVFLPVLFMGGIVGRLLHEFAVTIGVAILVSGLVSISLTPMLCSRFLTPPHAQKHGWFYSATERVLDAWLRSYDATLRLTLRFRAATMAISIALIAATVYLFIVIPKGFLPTEDLDRLGVNTTAAQGISFPEMVRRQEELAKIVQADPNVATVMDLINGGNSANLSVDLKPRAQRKLSLDQIMQELRPQLAQVPGITAFLNNPTALNIGARSGRALYQLTLQDIDTAELYHWIPILEAKMNDIPIIQDVNTDLQVKNPQLSIDLDRNRITALGLTVNQVETAMANAYSLKQVSQIYAPDNQYQVILGVAPQFQMDASAINELYVRSSSGRLIALNSVAKATRVAGPLTISHTGQLPSVTIAFNLKPGVALGDAVNAVQREASLTLPSTISMAFQGNAQAFQDSLRGLGLLLVMAIIVIYIVLGVLYESFTDPLTILSGLPSAGFGALLTLMIFKLELNLYAFVGVIMLIGIVKKNGIMMVDFAVAAQREHRKDPLEAIHEACLVRFRPIMMTTMCALVGTLPIALGLGAGGESRRPLGLAVVGGLLVSQVLTLYITPVYYVYIERARIWLVSRKSHKAVRPQHEAPLAALPSLERERDSA
jgi:HAE1 family hydrophobic/amphiphilic exporter-1